ncbi:MAG: 3-oxoacyl-ACP reductase FabG [Desulfobacterales bacterium]|nr:3-oxoacyl-ACP reductase FabG [Desulfobacterales bacterium]
MQNNIHNQPVAIVTGGARGIGAACCRALAAEGFYIGLHCRGSIAKAEAVLAEEKVNGFLLNADLTDINQVEVMVNQIKDQVGRVDVLVNNAGFSINNTIMAMKMEEFDAQRALLRGVFYLVKRVLRLFMLRQKKAKIINISSIVGHTGNAGQIPYTMEKGALDAMTKSLAKELTGRNIMVNSVAPGFIDTDMTEGLTSEWKEKILSTIPLGRMGKSEEVAEVVAFLASRGSYINGSVIHVNGGIYAG